MTARAPGTSKRWPRLVSALAGLAFTSACNGSTGSGTGTSSGTAATPAEVQALCDSQCAHSGRCSSGGAVAHDAGACADSCAADLGHLATAVRGDIARGLATCYATLQCGVNDDGCTTQAFAAATGGGVDAAIHAPDVQACLDKHRECAGTSGSFSDDTCGTMLLLVDAKRAETARCLQGSCDALRACLAPIFGR